MAQLSPTEEEEEERLRNIDDRNDRMLAACRTCAHRVDGLGLNLPRGSEAAAAQYKSIFLSTVAGIAERVDLNASEAEKFASDYLDKKSRRGSGPATEVAAAHARPTGRKRGRSGSATDGNGNNAAADVAAAKPGRRSTGASKTVARQPAGSATDDDGNGIPADVHSAKPGRRSAGASRAATRQPTGSATDDDGNDIPADVHSVKPGRRSAGASRAATRQPAVEHAVEDDVPKREDTPPNDTASVDAESPVLYSNHWLAAGKRACHVCAQPLKKTQETIVCAAASCSKYFCQRCIDQYSGAAPANSTWREYFAKHPRASSLYTDIGGWAALIAPGAVAFSCPCCQGLCRALKCRNKVTEPDVPTIAEVDVPIAGAREASNDVGQLLRLALPPQTLTAMALAASTDVPVRVVTSTVDAAPLSAQLLPVVNISTEIMNGLSDTDEGSGEGSHATVPVTVAETVIEHSKALSTLPRRSNKVGVVSSPSLTWKASKPAVAVAAQPPKAVSSRRRSTSNVVVVDEDPVAIAEQSGDEGGDSGGRLTSVSPKRRRLKNSSAPDIAMSGAAVDRPRQRMSNGGNGTPSTSALQSKREQRHDLSLSGAGDTRKHAASVPRDGSAEGALQAHDFPAQPPVDVVQSDEHRSSPSLSALSQELAANGAAAIGGRLATVAPWAISDVAWRSVSESLIARLDAVSERVTHLLDSSAAPSTLASEWKGLPPAIVSCSGGVSLHQIMAGSAHGFHVLGRLLPGRRIPFPIPPAPPSVSVSLAAALPQDAAASVAIANSTAGDGAETQISLCFESGAGTPSVAATAAPVANSIAIQAAQPPDANHSFSPGDPVVSVDAAVTSAASATESWSRSFMWRALTSKRHRAIPDHVAACVAAWSAAAVGDVVSPAGITLSSSPSERKTLAWFGVDFDDSDLPPSEREIIAKLEREAAAAAEKLKREIEAAKAAAVAEAATAAAATAARIVGVTQVAAAERQAELRRQAAEASEAESAPRHISEVIPASVDSTTAVARASAAASSFKTTAEPSRMDAVVGPVDRSAAVPGTVDTPSTWGATLSRPPAREGERQEYSHNRESGSGNRRRDSVVMATSDAERVIDVRNYPNSRDGPGYQLPHRASPPRHRSDPSMPPRPTLSLSQTVQSVVSPPLDVRPSRPYPARDEYVAQSYGDRGRFHNNPQRPERRAADNNAYHQQQQRHNDRSVRDSKGMSPPDERYNRRDRRSRSRSQHAERRRFVSTAPSAMANSNRDNGSAPVVNGRGGPRNFSSSTAAMDVFIHPTEPASVPANDDLGIDPPVDARRVVVAPTPGQLGASITLQSQGDIIHLPDVRDRYPVSATSADANRQPRVDDSRAVVRGGAGLPSPIDVRRKFADDGTRDPALDASPADMRSSLRSIEPRAETRVDRFVSASGSGAASHDASDRWVTGPSPASSRSRSRSRSHGDDRSRNRSHHHRRSHSRSRRSSSRDGRDEPRRHSSSHRHHRRNSNHRSRRY